MSTITATDVHLYIRDEIFKGIIVLTINMTLIWILKESVIKEKKKERKKFQTYTRTLFEN